MTISTRPFNICYILSELKKTQPKKLCAIYGPLHSFPPLCQCILFLQIKITIKIIIDLHQFTTEKTSMHEIFRGYEFLNPAGSAFQFIWFIFDHSRHLFLFSLFCIVFDLILIIYLEKKFSIFIHSKTNFSDESSTFTSNVVA